MIFPFRDTIRKTISTLFLFFLVSMWAWTICEPFCRTCHTLRVVQKNQLEVGSQYTMNSEQHQSVVCAARCMHNSTVTQFISRFICSTQIDDVNVWATHGKVECISWSRREESEKIWDISSVGKRWYNAVSTSRLHDTGKGNRRSLLKWKGLFQGPSPCT